MKTIRKRYFGKKNVKPLVCEFLGYMWQLLVVNRLNLFENMDLFGNTLIMTSRKINIDIDDTIDID